MKAPLVFVVLLLFLHLPQRVYADWLGFGAPIVTREGDQKLTCVVSVGDGIIIFWDDFRSGDVDVYAQKLGFDGRPLWAENGILVAGGSGPQNAAQAVPDGSDGAIITWSNNYDILAQRLASDGTPLWNASGVPVTNAIGDKIDPAITLCDSGCVIIAWADARNGVYDIYAQQVDFDGERKWLVEGVVVCGATGSQAGPQISSTTSGGAIVVWQDRRVNNNDIYIQKLSSAGTTEWAADGVPITTDSGSQQDVKLVTDSSGNAYVCWLDLRAGAHVFVQMVDAAGAQHWPPNFAVTTSDGQTNPEMVSAWDGVLVVWQDQRTPLNDIYAQRFRVNGEKVWTPTGLPVSRAYDIQRHPSVRVDEDGHATITWQDERYSPDDDIFAQRIDSTGVIFWSQDGQAVCRAPGPQGNTFLTSGDVGTVILWQDSRSVSSIDIFAQRVNADGSGAFDPTPSIISVQDVPNDQGGHVLLEWQASSFDYSPHRFITHYSIWRSQAAGNQSQSASGPYSSEVFNPIVRSIHGLSWEWVADVEAHYFEEYAFTTPTRFDSASGDSAWHLFLISAHTDDPFEFWDSAPDSGYSVDNLPPGPPHNFVGSAVSGGLSLSWARNREPDLAHYSLHRGFDAEFEPDGSNLIAEPPDTNTTDTEWDPRQVTVYKLLAVDIHDNRSPAAIFVADSSVPAVLHSYNVAFNGRWVDVNWRLTTPFGSGSFQVMRMDLSEPSYRMLEGPVSEQAGLIFSFHDKRVDPERAYRYKVQLVDGTATFVLFESDPVVIPRRDLTLYQNFPNPFNPSTTIQYYLPEASPVRISIFDAQGRLVRTMKDDEVTAGLQEVIWDGLDASGGKVASGTYFCRLMAGDRALSRTMLLVR